MLVALGSACGGAATTADSNDAGARADGGDATAPTLPDAAGPETGPADAGADASFCATNSAGHDFCEDFDRPVQIGGGRFAKVQVDESTARLIQENDLLRAEVVKIDAAAGVFAPAWLWLERPWARLGDGSRPRVVIRYKLRIEECPVSGVSGPGLMAGIDRDPFYSWTVEPVIFLDVDCRVRIFAVNHREIDGGVRPGPVYLQSDFVSVPTKQWLDVTMEAKEGIDNVIKTKLRIGTQERTLDMIDARSQADLLSVQFGASKSTSANVFARYLLDDLLVDHTKP